MAHAINRPLPHGAVMSHKEIAEKLNMTRAGVAVVEERALQKFAVRLQERLGRDHPGVDPEKLLSDFASSWIG
jgi:hypothetical protein